MSFFNRVFGAPAPAPVPTNPFASSAAPSSQPPASGFVFGSGAASSSSSAASSSSSFPQPHFLGQPVELASSSGSSARWEAIGSDAALATQSPLNPFRDDASSDATAPPSARTYFSMVAHGGRLWSFGGFGDAKGRFADLRAFDLEARTWQLVVGTGEVPRPLYLHSAVVWDGEMFVFGGSVGKDSNDLYAFNFTTRVWRKILPQANAVGVNAVPSPRYGHAAVVHGDQMLVCGGCRQNNIYASDAYVYAFRTNTWRRIADIPVDIAYHSLVAYQGRVLLINGYNGVRFNGQIFSYDMTKLSQPFLGNTPPTPWVPLAVTAKASSSFSSAGTRAPAASCGSAVVLGGDFLFLFAGYTAAGHANDTYKLDLRSCEWEVLDSPVASRPVSRAYLQAALHPTDGCMYVLGGYDGAKCVSDFRRIQVMPPDVDLYSMLSNVDEKQIASLALKHFGKPSVASAGPLASAAATSLDQAQLEYLFGNLKSHHRAAAVAAAAAAAAAAAVPMAPPMSFGFGSSSSASSSSSPFVFGGGGGGGVFGGGAGPSSFASVAAASSSSSSSLSSASSVWYPFDVSRLDDLMELGFSRATCLECLEDMYKKKQDTRHFPKVVEALLNFIPSEQPPPAPAPAPAQPTPAPQPPQQQLQQSPQPSPTRADSVSVNPIHPPSSNNDSLQEQVSRLAEENRELKVCKVCMENTIDCLLLPCAHLVVCSECAADLQKRKLECPSARCTIKSHMKVFWS